MSFQLTFRHGGHARHGLDPLLPRHLVLIVGQALKERHKLLQVVGPGAHVHLAPKRHDLRCKEGGAGG